MNWWEQMTFNPFWFDWGAAVAALAVAGAYRVGLRQSEILEKQTQVEALKLRAELFERRLEVFSALETTVATVRRGEGPQGSEMEALLDSRAAARFLFGSTINQVLDDIADAWYDFAGARDGLHNNEDPAKAEPLEGYLIEKREHLEVRILSARALMRSEMSLAEPWR